MSFNFHELTYIVSVLDNTVNLLNDGARISISTVIESNESTKWAVLNLDFPLRNGYAEISIGECIGVVQYYDVTGEQISMLEFNDRAVKELVGSFNLVLKELISIDKQNKQSQLTASGSIEDSEMNKLRAQLSGIN